MTELADILGQQAGNTLDQLCRNVMNVGTTIQYSGNRGSTAAITIADKLSRTEVREAVRTLEGNDTMKIMSMVDASSGFNTSPLRPAYVGIVGDDSAYDLRGETGWISIEEYGQKGDIMEGEIGSLEGVRFVMTTNSSTSGTAGVDGITVHLTLIFGRDYYGITRISGKALENIDKPLGSSGTADPLNQRATKGWKASFITTRLNENFCVRLEHSVTG